MCGAPFSSTSRSASALRTRRELAVLEVAQAAVDQLGRRRRGVRGEVVLLAQQRRAAPRPARSRAMPAPLMPPPTTSTSTSRARCPAGSVVRSESGSCIATILASTTKPQETSPCPARPICSPSTRAPRARARSSSTRAAPIVAVAQREFRADLSRSPAGSSTTRARSGRRSSRSRARRSRRAGVAAARHRRDRHHQPARDDGRLGPRAPASRSATRSSGRTGAPRRPATR